VCVCVSTHPPTRTQTHTHTADDARLLGPGQRLAAGLSNDAASNVAIPHFFLLTNFNLEESEHNHSMVMQQVPGDVRKLLSIQTVENTFYRGHILYKLHSIVIWRRSAKPHSSAHSISREHILSIVNFLFSSWPQFSIVRARP
jgi:hypothetical protein